MCEVSGGRILPNWINFVDFISLKYTRPDKIQKISERLNYTAPEGLRKVVEVKKKPKDTKDEETSQT